MLRDRIPELNALCLQLDNDSSLMSSARALEEHVWDISGFNDAGGLGDYDIYCAQARAFAVFREDGACLGVSRVFAGRPKLPPFVSLPFYEANRKSELEASCHVGRTDELATAAVAPHVPFATASIGMWRLAYRDAVARRVESLGIIMEPRRVRAMNRAYGLCFEQLGPEVYYQGGYCAAHLLLLDSADIHMRKVNPAMHEWFTLTPLAD